MLSCATNFMGSHIIDYGGQLHRWRTAADGSGQILHDAAGLPLGPESAPPAEQKGEGCNVQGGIIVKMVPGNFHVSAHAHAHLLSLFFDTTRGETLHCTHFIRQ
jgi:hypothetical protein